jgi:hypothetical protein
LPFYLILTLPTTVTLSREQAATLLLRDHLSVSAELSYVESSPQPYTASAARSTVPRGPSHGSTVSALAAHATARAAPAPAARDPPVPITPAPYPSTRSVDASFTDLSGIAVWSYAFQDIRADSSPASDGAQQDYAKGRVWLGKARTPNSDQEAWVAVWEFKGDIGMSTERRKDESRLRRQTALIQVPLREPRACLTVTVSFRDDPRLLAVFSPEGHPTPNGDAEFGDDDYLIETFDGGLVSRFPATTSS